MDVTFELVLAALLGVPAAILLDCSYHRLMHVPFRSGPLKKLFLYHFAHHRFPQDPAILSFRPLRRMFDLALALAALALFGLLRLSVADARQAALMAVLFVLPSWMYNHVYDPLHTWVHMGGEPPFAGRALLRRIRVHHLAHHAHAHGTAAFAGARRLSLIFPFV